MLTCVLLFAGVGLTATLKWRKLTTSGALPSGRNYHTASVVGKKLYIFGGFGNNTWLSDMHIFNTGYDSP